MKRIINLLTFAAMLAVCAAPALAQAAQCTDENKAAWYDTFLKNFKGDPAQQKTAYDAAKQYLTTCPADPADKRADYMQNKFVVPYEKMSAGTALKTQFEEAFTKKNYADQIRLGKQVVAAEPDNTAAYIIMGVAGLGDANQLNEAAPFAKKAIELIESGKPFAPLATKDAALAFLNDAVAKASLKTAPADAIPFFIKAAKLESALKKDPQFYLDLANAYAEGPIAKQSEEYKAKYANQTETPESKLAVDNLNQFIDRQIDALARATALTTNPAGKKTLMDLLTGLYTDRKKPADGLPALLSSVLSTPVPDIPTMLTLPAPAATPTPAATPSPTPAKPATTSRP
ncbi:MAG TPA: hypothetical protein VGO56_06660 [Pyrinomonadaceae bacterium]|jgi:hypothetical protein|nr:hypothetical protein [Pyrinomonadaceae bacterium]